jgi:integrase
VRLLKKCRHGKDRWDRCGCAWLVADWQPERRAYAYENAGTDRREAERRLRQLLLQRERGEGGTTLAALVSRYLAELRHANRAERTVATYTVYLNRAVEWFGPEFPIRQVDTLRLEEFRAALVASGRERTYATLVIGILRQALTLALREGSLAQVPAVAPPIVERGRRERARLSVAECERVIAALRPPWRSAGELILLTGLRIGEVLALTPEAIDMDAGVLRVEGTLGPGGRIGPPKTETSRRAVRLSPRAHAIVGARLLEAMPGERLWPGSVDGAARDAIRNALDRTGLHRQSAGWHQLRHAHRTLLAQAGYRVSEMAARMGHGGNVAMTLRYGAPAEHADPASIDAARAR